MTEYRIVKIKGFSNNYKIQRKTGFWIFKLWETLYSSLTLDGAQEVMETIKRREEWAKNNPVAKRDTVIETFKF